jgi:protein PhnA
VGLDFAFAETPNPHLNELPSPESKKSIMSFEQELLTRSEHKCELCGAEKPLTVYEVSHGTGRYAENCMMICDKCLAQVEKKEEPDPKHWGHLGETMWSEVPGIQVISWRMLNRFRNESWAADLLDMMYLDEDRLTWAKAAGDHENDSTVELHKDCNGAQLLNGDTVVLIKSLDVKGSTLNAKLGTVVKNIRIVEDNKEQIEGRIEGQVIVILTKYVRKQLG